MANEFKVRKGLIVNGSGSVILDIQGSQGQLFSVTDQLSGSLFSVNDISGMPILGVSSDDSVRLGTFNREAIIVSGSNARITGSLFGTASWASNAITASNALTSSFVLNAVSASFAATASSVNPLVQNVQITGSTNISGSINVNGGLSFTGASGTAIISTNAANYGTARIGQIGGFDFQYAAFNSGQTVVGYHTTIARNGLVTQGGGTLHVWNQSSPAQPIVFGGQNSAEVFRIATNGFIGVGKTNPSVILDISGSQIITGSLNVSSGITGSLFGTSSWALNSTTASFVLNAVSASFAATASSADNFVIRQNATASNLLVNNTITAQTLVVQTITSSVDFVTGSTRFGSLLTDTHQFTGSVSVTGSLSLNDSPVVTNATFTPTSSSISTRVTNLESTASVLTTASASFALVSSSYAAFSQSYNTASFTGSFTGTLIGTASWAINAISASFATTASNAISASFAATASFVPTSSLTGNFFVQGGNSFGTQALLGTNDNQDLAFETSGSVRMFVSSSGAVGINTTTPSASLSLDVNGNARIGTNLTIQSGDIIFGAANRFIATTGAPLDTIFTSTVRSLQTLRSSGGTNGITFTNNSPTNTMRIWDNGNVLIQTGGTYADSGFKLDVSGSTRIQSSLTVSGSTIITGSVQITGSLTAPNITGSLFGTASWALNAITASNALTASFVPTSSLIGNFFVQGGNSFGAQAVLGTNDNQDLAFETNGSTRMFIASNGNIGIGTTAPSNILDIIGASPTLRIQVANNAQTSTISLSATDGNIRGGISANIASGEIRMGALGSGGYFPTFYSNAVEAMRIPTSRNVLIATTTDSGFRLDIASAGVSGSFRSVGTSIVSGSFITTGSVQVTGSLTAPNITGSLFGTASWALNAVSASFATTASNATSASFVLNAISASFASTASFVPGYVSGSGTSGQVAYWNGTNTQAGSNNLFWDNTNGRLGIGTTSPSRTLIVAGGSIGITSDFNGLYFPNGSVYSGGGTLRLQNGTNYYDITNSNIQYWVTSNVERMRLFSTGHLAIGSSTDSGFRLDIATSGTSGSFRSIGASVVSGSLITTGSLTLIGNQIITGSSTATGGYTGSLFGTASWALNAITASNATTASFVLNAVSASFAATASSADDFLIRQNATASNLLVSNTITAQTLVVQTITSSVDFVTGSTRFGTLLTNTHQFTGSVSVTGSLSVNDSPVVTNSTFTPFSSSVSTRVTNLESTASVLTTASASFALVSSSYAAFSQSYNTGSFTGSFTGTLIGTASWASNATTASFVLNAVSSSFASTASSVNPLVQTVLITGSLFVSSSNATQLLVGSSSLFVSSSGFIGIGTNNPFTRLNLEGGDLLVRGGIITVGPNSGGDGAFQLKGELSGVLGSFVLFTQNSSAIQTERMRVNSNGNVGIGSTSPVYLLDVAGTLRNTGNAFLATTSGNVGIGSTVANYKLDVTGNLRNTGDAFLSTTSGNVGIGSTGANYKLDVAGSLRSTGDTFLATAGTNVGIGTTVPTTRLDVSGGARITSNLTVSGSTLLTGSLTLIGNEIITGSSTATGGYTGSLFGTSSWAQNVISSSYAATASILLGSVVSASFASTASSVNTLVQPVLISGSFTVFTGSAVEFQVTNTGVKIGNVGLDIHTITGSIYQSGSTVAASLRGSGSAVFSVDGTSGRLFQVDDSLSGSLFSVNTAAGLPIIEAFSDNTVRIAQFGQRAFFVSQSVVGIGKESLLNGKLDVSGSAFITGSLSVSQGITGSLFGTSSWAQNVISASFAGTASVLLGSVVSASFATTASFAQTASFVVNTVSASFAATASSVNPLVQNVLVTGSLFVSSSNQTQLQVGSNILFVSSSGNVGIGTTTPSYRLDIVGINNVISRIRSTTNTGASSYLAENDVNSTYEMGMWGSTRTPFGSIDSDNAFLYGGKPLAITSLVAIKFGTGLSVTERMRIDVNGNVGIGTTNPVYRLQVNANSASNAIDSITVQNSGVTSVGHISGIRFRYNTAEPAAIRSILENITTGVGRLGLFVSTDGTGTNLTEYLSISASGNVGIGTTVPTTRLDVSGGARITSNLTVSGSTLLTGSFTLIGNEIITGSSTATGGYTGSLFGTSSWALNAVTASNATTASFVLQAVSASFAATASSADNFLIRQNATASNLLVNNTITAQTLVVQTITSSVDFVTGSTRFGSLLTNTHQFTGSVTITGSLSVNDSPVITNATFTPFSSSVSTRVTNLESTASVLTTASASFATVSSSFATTSASLSTRVTNLESTASVLTTASASFAIVSSSFATTSGSLSTRVTTLENASASFAQQSGSNSTRLANLETTASVLTTASASFALVSSSYAALSGSFRSGSFTGSFTGALIGTASWAQNVVSASFASTASSVNTLNQNVIITGSLTVGSGSIGSGENTLILGPAPSGGTGEGGQILLSAVGGVHTSASMLDNYQNRMRVLRGTNAGSDAEVASFNMHNRQLTLHAYNSPTAFAGTSVANLSVDSSGNVITTATGTVTSASFASTASFVNPLSQTVILTGSLNTTGSVFLRGLTTSSQANVVGYDVATGQLYYQAAAGGGGSSVTASYALTASAATDFTVRNTITLDRSLMDYATVASSVVGSNNLFTQATGSYSSAFFKYTAANGANARSGEVMAVWNAASVQFTDNSTLDIGSTTPVTCSVSVVGTDVQFNVQTNTSGWTIKSVATYM